MIKCISNLAFTFGFGLFAVLAQASEAADPWAPCRFLIGDWVGEGSGAPGQGSGAFSLALELEDKIMVRRNHAEYPATGGRPAVRHEDLMVIYPSSGGKGLQASYWDNEGHFIHYALNPSPDGRTLTFVSDVVSGAPRFRLTYTKKQPDTVGIKFEIAAPGKPDGFKTYLEAAVHRRNK
jgi:hypothetical protein